MRIRIIDDYKYLKEMADGLADIKRELRSSSEQIRENLMQIFLWRDSTAVNHWESELYAVCHSVSKCRHNKKYPKSSDILQEIWSYWEDSYYDKLQKYILQIEYKENNTAPSFNAIRLYNFIKDYCIWLSEVFSKDGLVTFPEVKEIVSELLDKYVIQ